ARVGHGRGGERGGGPGAGRSGAGLERRPGERGEQQHEAEIGVRGRPPGGRFHGGANRGAEGARGGGGQGGPDRRRTREEILVPSVMKVGARRHVSGLRGARLEQARELRGDGDVGPVRRARHRGATRPSTCSTIAAATSMEVASCRPRHPGIPFTSTTYSVPSRAGRRSTPAYSAPTAPAAVTASAARSGSSVTARARPPRARFVFQAGGGALRSIAPSTRPPTTNARTSQPPWSIAR